ncbi:MAG: phosphate ABC transporter permease subunit PstC [Desulfobulbaceae bacterium]|nr:phosphate ABC transporter permease subunit PstC [Desulfobulbaceae bacterium]HIJ79519.1 phosphate ABC transporter permease subunit PstC [Deltaproteobacteria bacterium]
MWKDKVIHLLLVGTASTSILIVLLIFLFLGKEAGSFIFEPGLKELFDRSWIPVSFVRERFGLLPLLSGSAVVTAIAMVTTVPISVLAAVYIAEVARPTEREILKPFIEILAGIPSVVLGFFGLIVLAPLIKELFGLSSGLNALTGGILLALMAVPTVVTISEDAIMSVPFSYKNASLALGASELQTIWKVTVPAALPGIIAAIMLGVGRVIGETMAVLMVTGNSALITLNPLSPVRTMTATIAAEMGEVPIGSVHYQALFCIGITLLIITFLLNVVARVVLNKYGMKK